MGQLMEVINIGKKIEKRLNAIGVHTMSDLKKMGSIEAWQRMRDCDPEKDCCICAIYALEGAIVGIRWNEIPEEIKSVLKKKVDRKA